MPTYTFNHVHHETDDVNKAIEFYTRIFQATVDGPIERDGNQWAWVQLGGTQVVVTDREASPTSLERLKGLDHFSLVTDDFDATLETIRREGVSIWKGPLTQNDVQRIVFITGPDNIKIELMEKV